MLIDGNPYLHLDIFQETVISIGTFTGAVTVLQTDSKDGQLIFAFIAILLLLAGLTSLRKSLYRPIRKMEQSMKESRERRLESSGK